MNPTFVWIETLMMMLTGIMVVPALLDAARSVTGAPGGVRLFVADDGRMPRGGMCRRREAPDEPIRLMFSRWRVPGDPIVLYQLVV